MMIPRRADWESSVMHVFIWSGISFSLQKHLTCNYMLLYTTPLLFRFLRHVPVIYVDYPGPSSLTQIYGTFNRAMLRLVPSLRSFSQPLTDAMVEFYTKSQVIAFFFYLSMSWKSRKTIEVFHFKFIFVEAFLKILVFEVLNQWKCNV